MHFLKEIAAVVPFSAGYLWYRKTSSKLRTEYCVAEHVESGEKSEHYNVEDELQLASY